MRKEKILYSILAILFVTYVILEYYEPKPIDWTITYAEKDKNPYGSYILYDRLEDFYEEKKVSFQTLSEVKDSSEHILILTERFSPSSTDINSIFKILNKGRSIFIGAKVFSEEFLDTLGISYDFKPLKIQSLDTVLVTYGGRNVKVPESFIISHFYKDSINNFDIQASSKDPLLISKNIGAGSLILTTAPQLFTNYSLLKEDYADLAATALRMIPRDVISYNRFYMSGKPEATTPLRFLLSKEALTYATYIAVFLLFIFLIVRSQRTQRAIPVLDKNVNTTVEFIKTIGGLYYRESDNKNAAQKLIARFTKSIGSRYQVHHFDERGFQNLASKSGVPVVDVVSVFDLIAVIRSSPKISEEQLKELYKKLNQFKIH